MPALAKSFVGAPLVPAFDPHEPRRGLALSRTADADPPRLIGWRSLHHRMPSLQRSLSPLGHRQRDLRLSSPAGSIRAAARSRGHISRTCIDPSGQDRAGAERFKNSAAHDPERLPSCLKLTGFIPLVDTTCPVVHARQAAPRTRSLDFLSGFSPRPPVKGCLGSSRARPRFHRPCLSAPCGRDQRCVRPTSAIPHFKDEHPHFARLPTRFPELPPVLADE